MLDPTKTTSPHYFGGMKFESGEMVGKVTEMFDGLAEEATDQLKKQLTLAARAIAAESTVKTPGADSNAAELAELDSGRELAKRCEQQVAELKAQLKGLSAEGEHALRRV